MKLSQMSLAKIISALNDAYSDHVLRRLELPEGDINRDTTLTLSLELVEHPC